MIGSDCYIVTTVFGVGLSVLGGCHEKLRFWTIGPRQ